MKVGDVVRYTSTFGASHSAVGLLIEIYFEPNRMLDIYRVLSRGMVKELSENSWNLEVISEA